MRHIRLPALSYRFVAYVEAKGNLAVSIAPRLQPILPGVAVAASLGGVGLGLSAHLRH